MKKLTDRDVFRWLRKNGQRQTLYRWAWMSVDTRAMNRARVKAAIRAEQLGGRGR